MTIIKRCRYQSALPSTPCTAWLGSEVLLIIATQEVLWWLVFYLFVSLIAESLEKLSADFNEIFSECWYWEKEQIIKFWWHFGWPSGSRRVFKDSEFGTLSCDWSTKPRGFDHKAAAAGSSTATGELVVIFKLKKHPTIWILWLDSIICLLSQPPFTEADL